MTSAPKYSDELIATMNQFFVVTEPEPNEEADTEPNPAINHMTPELMDYLYNYDFEANPIDTEEDDNESKLDSEDIYHNQSDHVYIQEMGHLIFYRPVLDYIPAELFKEWTNHKPGFCRHCDNEQRFCYERKHGIEEDNKYDYESDEEYGTEYDNESDEEYDTESDNESDNDFNPRYNQTGDHSNCSSDYEENDPNYSDKYEWEPRFDDNDCEDDSDDNNHDDYYDDYNEYQSDDFFDGIT